MSMFIIKLIALITMTIDHVGVYIFPGQIGYRIVGRLSFVLFAFLIVNGAKYTKNKNKYLLRLFVMALISQIPDMLASINYGGNIFFTLSLGLAMIMLLDSPKLSNIIYYIILLISSSFLDIDYGTYGVLVISAFYLIDKYSLNYLQQIIIFILLNYYGVHVQHFLAIQYYSMISLPIIWLYNQQKGYSNVILNRLFYWYYIVHLLLLMMISKLL